MKAKIIITLERDENGVVYQSLEGDGFKTYEILGLMECFRQEFILKAKENAKQIIEDEKIRTKKPEQAKEEVKPTPDPVPVA